MKKIIVASDSFKGTYASLQIAEKISDILIPAGYAVYPIDMSDGGEGFCQSLTHALHGVFHQVDVHDPLMRPITATYGTANDTAIIEMAAANGLSLLRPDEYDPWNATTFGTGELIADALRKGYRQFIVGLGGSATSDCGMGMLDALKDYHTLLEESSFLIASDVTNPLCGPHGAAHVYARQKGADDSMIQQLEKRSSYYGALLERISGRSIIHIPGSGAAGGLGAAFLSLPHVNIRSGADIVLDAHRFDIIASDAYAVITGEGCIDSQTLQGKVPYKIALRAKELGVPSIAIYGKRELSVDGKQDLPWLDMLCINHEGFTNDLIKALGTLYK